MQEVRSIITLNADKLNSIPNIPGIYIFYNIDDVILYLGTSSNINERIKAHFKRVSNFSPLEVEKIRYWTFENMGNRERVLFEKVFIKKYNPKYNLNIVDLRAQDQEFNVKLPSEEESKLIILNKMDTEFCKLLHRIEIKSFFLQELCHQCKILGISYKAKKILVQHCKDLLDLSLEIEKL